MIGNVWTWDVGTIAALDADGAVNWQKGLFPAPAGGCPEVLTQVAATDYGTLAFGVGSLAEGFTCFPNGIPEAAFVFSGNSSDGRWGSFQPAGPLAVSGNRILYPTRFLAAGAVEEPSSQGVEPRGGAAASTATAAGTAGASASSPPSQWYLAALDQNTEGVSRMTWAWTAALPTGPAPSNGLGCSTPQMAGPMVVRVAQAGLAGAFADVAVIAFSCNGSATLSAVLVNVTTPAAGGVRAAAVHAAAPAADRRSWRHASASGVGGQAAAPGSSSGGIKFGADPNILTCPTVWSPDAAPCLLWTRNVTLAGPADAVLALAADRVNAAAAAAGAEDIWLSTAGVPGTASSQLMRFDGLSGDLVTSIDLGDALMLTESGNGASVATATASPGWMLLSGSMLAVAFRTDAANASAGMAAGNRQQSQQSLNGLRGPAAAASAGTNVMMVKALSAACGDSGNWNSIAAAVGAPLYGIAAFSIGSNVAAAAAPVAPDVRYNGSESTSSGSDAAAGLLWCTLTPSLGAGTGSGSLPGTYPVVGQPAALAPGVLLASAAGAVVIVTAEGAIAAIG